MKSLTNSKHYQISVLTLLSLLSTTQIAKAATFEGSASAVFGTPTPNSGVEFSGVGTNVFSTGEIFDSSSTANIFAVDGMDFSTTEENQFAIADLSYTNGVTATGSTVDSVPLDLTLDFTTPSGLSETFTFTFDFNFTANTTGDPVLDADNLSILDVFSSTNFEVEGQLYTLELLGFSNNDGATISNSFTLPEDATTTSQLLGRISPPDGSPNPDPDPDPKPDPDTAKTPESTSSAALVLLGIGVVFSWKNRRRTHN
jgi:hypothetical protein